MADPQIRDADREAVEHARDMADAWRSWGCTMAEFAQRCRDQFAQLPWPHGVLPAPPEQEAPRG